MTTAILPGSHSFYRPDEHPTLQHLGITLTPVFSARTLIGTVVLTFDRPGKVSLDTRKLNITSIIEHGTFTKIPFALGEEDAIFGSSLDFEVPENCRVVIDYDTKEASGLQWLTPEQTSSKRHPFLFSQGEAIHARSYVPCQDTPAVRVTYTAALVVPKELRGLMAADTFVGRLVKDREAYEQWEMSKPIAPYLIAFAVGDLVSKDISDRTKVWAEPVMIEQATIEFEDMPQIMSEAEKLFGQYQWGRFDILVMPRSFPYGGMENPTLTFVTPSLVTGDKSLVGVVAHELAHAWTGNLVTNATWSDFWLNEGWTEWATFRIVEAVWGKEAANLERAIMAGELKGDLQRFHENGTPHYCQLHFNQDGIDPDDVFSRVPYKKGADLLESIETYVGRERFDLYVRSYIATFGFKSITTEKFLAFTSQELPGALEAVKAEEWIFGQNMPDTKVPLESAWLDEVHQYADKGLIPPVEVGTKWHPTQWALYLEYFPRPADEAVLLTLSKLYQLSAHPNTEIRYNWLLLGIQSGMNGLKQPVANFLQSNGRMKYLKPLYKALATNPEFIAFAEEVFEKCKSGYHPVAQKSIQKTFEEAKKIAA